MNDRTQIAMAVVHGLISTWDSSEDRHIRGAHITSLVEESVYYADLLIAELERTAPKEKCKHTAIVGPGYEKWCKDCGVTLA